MALRVEIDETPVDPEQQGKANLYHCTVRDDDRPALVGSFGYMVIRNDAGRVMGIDGLTITVSVDPHHPEVAGAKVTPSMMRDLPLVRWDKAARAKVVEALGPTSIGKWSEDYEVLGLSDEDMTLLVSRVLVRIKFPGLEEQDSPAAKRRHEGLLRLAKVAVEFSALSADGVVNPAKVISERHKVTHSTARSWIHRARQEGLLPHAVVGSPAREGTTDDQLHAAGVQLARMLPPGGLAEIIASRGEVE